MRGVSLPKQEMKNLRTIRSLYWRKNVKLWILRSIIILTLISIAVGPIGGCGGCALCGGEIKPRPATITTGQISVAMEGFPTVPSGSSAKYISISYTGGFTQGGEGTGSTSFNFSRTYEVLPGGGVNPAPQHNQVGLKPGLWTVTARSGNWSAVSGSGDVVKEKTTTFIFKLDSQEVRVQAQ